MFKKILPLFVCAIFILIPVFAFAQSPSTAGCGPSPLPPCSALGSISDPTFVGRNSDGNPEITTSVFVNTLLGLVNWFSWFIAVAAVVMGLYSGFLFITAVGDASKISNAKQVIVYSIIGITVAIVSFGFIAITKSILGI